jgi:hypothetical protein
MKKQNKKRLQDAKDAKAYRHRNKNWNYCHLIISRRLIELRDQLTEVTDLDLATTVTFNGELAELERMLATLEDGPKSVTDEFGHLFIERISASRRLLRDALIRPRTAKDYRDVIASRMHSILERADRYDRSDT